MSTVYVFHRKTRSRVAVYLEIVSKTIGLGHLALHRSAARKALCPKEPSRGLDLDRSVHCTQFWSLQEDTGARASFRVETTARRAGMGNRAVRASEDDAMPSFDARFPYRPRGRGVGAGTGRRVRLGKRVTSKAKLFSRESQLSRAPAPLSLFEVRT